MTKRLNQFSGFYEPSFFRLHISTENSIQDINQLNDLDFSIFLHEYIHFMQDLTTHYGLNNINYNVEYLRYASNLIINQGKSEFNVPIYPDAENTRNVLLNGKVCEVTFGDSEPIPNISKIKSYTKSKIPIHAPNDVIQEMDVIDVEVVDSANNEHYFSFGAGCIMESMAYLFEKLTCEDFQKSPDIPYNSAELLVDHIYPEFGIDKLNIIALCDISLNVSNPANYFILKLEEYKAAKVIPHTPEDLYGDFFSASMTLNNEPAAGFSSHFMQLSEAINSQLQGYFNDPHFNDLKNWISVVTESARLLRLNHPTFVIDLAKGRMRDNPHFKMIYNILGTPLMTTDRKEFRFYHPLAEQVSIEIGYFSAISQINQIFWGKSCGCDMKGMCSQEQSNTVVDERCDTMPWVRIYDTHLCPFALMWRHWGLADFKPIIDK